MKNNGKKQDYQHPLTADLKSVSQAAYDIESLLNRPGQGKEENHPPSMSDLRTSELRYRRLFETAQDGILLLDAKTGVITDANPFIANMLKYEPDELIGKRLWEIGVFHDAEDSKAAFEELQRNKYIRYEDLPLQTKNGESRQVEFVSNVYLANGRNVIQCNIRDITERRQAEEALEKERVRAQQYLDIAGVIFLVLAADRKVILINKKGCEILGYVDKEIIGRDWIDFLPRDQNERAGGVFDQLMAGQIEPVEFFENPILTKSGEERLIAWSNAVVTNKAGRIIGVVSSGEDITERRKTEEALRKAENKYRSIIENAVDGIFQTSPEGAFLTVNQAMARILGFASPEDLMQQRSDIAMQGYVDPQRREEFKRLMASDGAVSNFEYEVYRKDGTKIWISENAKAIRDDTGRILRYEGSFNEITERKKTENALRESDKKFHQLADNITDAFWIRSPDMSEVHYLSPAFERIWGRSVESLYAKPQQWSDFILPEDRERVLAAFDALTEHNLSLDIEYRIVRPGGEIRWIRVRGFQVWDSAGSLIRHIGIVTDTTDRKLAEEELQFRNLILTTQQEASIDGILVVDENARIISYNQRFVRMWDIAQELIEEIDDEPVLKFVASKVADSTSFQQRVQYIYEHRQETIQDEIVLKNGRIFDRYSAPMVGPADRYYGRVWYFRDITERKQAEKRIALLAHTLESITECVSITDLEDIVLFVNNAFLKTYGYTEQQIVGKNIHVVRSPDKPPKTTPGILQSTLKEGWTGELINRTKQGRDFPISLSTSTIRDKHGEVVALVGVATDITDQKKFQQQLLESQKGESIGTLAAGIAHDFNNILAIILGYTYLIENNRLDAQKLSENVASVHQAVHRGAELVRQILTFARKTEVSFEPIRLTDLVLELVSMLEQTFPKIITFKTTFSNDIPLILADRAQIHQVLLNLCVNARDAMPHGGSITIAVEKHAGEQLKEQFPAADQDSYICISVADVGEGMTELTRRRIFDPFFTTKPQGKGTGLGLAVVYGVLQAHQGFTDVESTLGHGSTFRIYLPIPNIALKQVDTFPAKPFESGGTETILLVEDEPDLLGMMRALLESKGYGVLVARDGAEAIEVYRNHIQEIALVVTDLGLPMMTGAEEFRRLKEIHPGVRVVFASGFFGPDIKSELVKDGAKDFLQKPYMADDILRTVRNALDRKDSEEHSMQRPSSG